MGLFDDKKYESMDDISKMIEPWENPYNDIISKLPDEWVVPTDIIERLLGAYDVDTYLFKHLFSRFLTPVEANLLMDSKLLDRQYVNGGYAAGLLDTRVSDNYMYNSVTREQNGTIKVVKTFKNIHEDKLNKMVLDFCYKEAFRSDNADYYISDSLRNLYEVLSGKTYESDSRSKRMLIQAVRVELHDFIKEDRWRIRSLDLYKKFIKWCQLYVHNGDSASIANIMKMKIMTYNGRAIYSVGEEK
jgi:hypothetical protein